VGYHVFSPKINAYALVSTFLTRRYLFIAKKLGPPCRFAYTQPLQSYYTLPESLFYSVKDRSFEFLFFPRIASLHAPELGTDQWARHPRYVQPGTVFTGFYILGLRFLLVVIAYAPRQILVNSTATINTYTT